MHGNMVNADQAYWDDILCSPQFGIVSDMSEANETSIGRSFGRMRKMMRSIPQTRE